MVIAPLPASDHVLGERGCDLLLRVYRAARPPGLPAAKPTPSQPPAATGHNDGAEGTVTSSPRPGGPERSLAALLRSARPGRPPRRWHGGSGEDRWGCG